jgi:DNA-binding beta-propeller fold protein YncE
VETNPSRPPRSLRRVIRYGFSAFAALVIAQAHADLFVSSQLGSAGGTILRYNQADGSFAGVFASVGGSADPLGLTFGPNGNLYVACGNANGVRRYDGRTAAFLGVFAFGVSGPMNMKFGPDGNLYVSSSSSQILRYDGRTGAFMDAFISDTRLDYPRGLTFGPDGDLYVVSYNQATVLRYSAAGTFLGTFVPSRSGGLFAPSDLVFGPDGNLYVTGGNSAAGVLRYNGNTGAFMGQFASVGPNAPIDLAYGPDGNLYVTVQGATEGVLRFNGQTGALIDNFVASNSGGLGGPFGLAFSPVPEPSTFRAARRCRWFSPGPPLETSTV